MERRLKGWLWSFRTSVLYSYFKIRENQNYQISIPLFFLSLCLTKILINLNVKMVGETMMFSQKRFNLEYLETLALKFKRRRRVWKIWNLFNLLSSRLGWNWSSWYFILLPPLLILLLIYNIMNRAGTLVLRSMLHALVNLQINLSLFDIPKW